MNLSFFRNSAKKGDALRAGASCIMLSLFILGFLSLAASAAVYYVDATLGDDAAAGTSEAAAWKTLAKVNSTKFRPGDSVLFKCNEVWRDQLIVSSSGTVTSPLFFGSYGAGSKPVFNAALTVAGWTSYSGSIYAASFSSPVAQVFVDGVYCERAHYPDQGYLIIDASSTDKTYLTDNDLSLSAEQVIGAEVFIRPVYWAIENRTVTGFSGGRISWSQATNDELRTGYGYYLSNKLWMLDSPGEWYYDVAAKKLYIWLADSTDPGTHQIEASSFSTNIYASSKCYFTVQNIEVRNSAANGVDLRGTTGVTLRDLDVSYARSNGIYLIYGADCVVDNCRALNNTRSGISCGGGTRITLERNMVRATGLVGTMPKYSTGAIYLSRNSGSTVRNNTVTDSGYIGIQLYEGTNNLIQNNYIERYNINLDDGGGIYLGGREIFGTRIDGNIVLNSVGNKNGTPQTGTMAQGIYLDDATHDTTVTNNTVSHVDNGIYFHNSYNNTATNNTVFDVRGVGLRFAEDTIVNQYGITKNNVVTGNIFIALGRAQLNGAFHGYLGFTNFGTYDYNYYGHFLGDICMNRVTGSGSAASSVSCSLAQWRALTGQDLHSRELGDIYRCDRVHPAGANLVANPSFDSGISGWGKWPSTVAISWTTSGGLDGGCLKAVCTDTAANSTVLVNSGSFPLTKGTTYTVTLDAVSTKEDLLKVIVRRGGPTYETCGSASFAVGPARRGLKFAFIAPDDVANARIDLETDAADTSYCVDNVVLCAANYHPGTDALLYYNPGTAPMTVSLGSNRYCDVDNRTVSGSFTLAPFTSKVLLNSYNNTDGTCDNWETYDTAPGDCSPGQRGEQWLKPPVLSGGMPSGTISAGTRQARLSLASNEAATCRYATSPGVPYDAMTDTFSSTGGVMHSTTVNGLQQDRTYRFYVRARDEDGNVTTDDYVITFTVPEGPVAPLAPVNLRVK